MQQRILGFDIARVVSMLYIIAVYHILGYTTILFHNPLILALVFSCLGTFTFLSSYLISSRYRFDSKELIFNYYKRRVLRIYPLFFLSSVVLLLIGFNDFPSTIKGLLGISPLWGPHPRTLWYVAMLLLFYVVTPLLTRGTIVKQLFAFIILCCFFLLVSFLANGINTGTFIYFAVYFIGVLLGTHFQDKVMQVLTSYKSLPISLVSFVLLLGNIFIDNGLYRIVSGIFGMFFILNISCVIGRTSFFKNHKRMESYICIISYASMCAYLFHRECYEAMLALYYPNNPIVLICYLFFIGIPVVMVISYYIQRFYDSIVSKSIS